MGWVWMSRYWRCKVCLKGSASPSFPVEGSCRGHSRLDSVVLDRLQHKVFARECDDNSHMFVCIRCRFYSSGAQVCGLGRLCQKPTVTGKKNWSKLKKGKHPDKPDVSVDIDLVKRLFYKVWCPGRTIAFSAPAKQARAELSCHPVFSCTPWRRRW